MLHIPLSCTVCEYLTCTMRSKAASTSSSVKRSNSSELCRDLGESKRERGEENEREDKEMVAAEFAYSLQWKPS